MTTPADRLRLLQEMAERLGQSPPSVGIELLWENEHLTAGVRTYADSAFVYLGNCQHQVANLQEAAAVLQAIFADEIVAVSAYDKDNLVFSGLAPAADPNTPLNVAGAQMVRAVLPFDDVVVETWSQGFKKAEDEA